MLKMIQKLNWCRFQNLEPNNLKFQNLEIKKLAADFGLLMDTQIWGLNLNTFKLSNQWNNIHTIEQIINL